MDFKQTGKKTKQIYNFTLKYDLTTLISLTKLNISENYDVESLCFNWILTKFVLWSYAIAAQTMTLPPRICPILVRRLD